MKWDRLHLALAAALMLSACGGLKASESLAQPLSGVVRRSCGPADGPALEFTLSSPDGETALSLYLWRGLPAAATQLTVMSCGLATFQGEICRAGDCRAIERLEIYLGPSQPGSVTGTLALEATQGLSLQADFRADWDETPGLLCG